MNNLEQKPLFVQLSGGRTSGLMGYKLKDNPRAVFMFQNTGREKPETYEFLHKMDKEWGLNLVWLEYSCPDPSRPATAKVVDYHTANRDGLPFEQLITKQKAIPNKFKRFCTIELKTKTARRWIRAQGYKKWDYAIGYRVDEPKRKVRSDSMQNAITPLRDLGITAREVGEFWSNNSFDLELPLMPNGKTFGGNCEGCFWHSEYQNAVLCRDRPESVKWLIAQEERMGYTFNEEFSFKELTKIATDKDLNVFSQQDFFCEAVNGSCGV